MCGSAVGAGVTPNSASSRYPGARSAGKLSGLLAPAPAFTPAAIRLTAPRTRALRLPLIGAFACTVSLVLAATVISVYKPWGRVRPGRRASARLSRPPAPRA